ncbi:uncharacterized protein LOC143277868 [Babylonia areolata]|uniref:uncharacterized protein LOC143277868 n=1 Tax=Babylonia areolata TaxID=304850 RepID=UPI003FCF9B36
MDPNWRGQLPPPPTFSFPGTAQMHPAHPYPVGPVSPQRFPPEGSCPSPMDLASSAPYTDSSGQQAFQGHFLQNPAFQGQGQPFVGQGAGVTGLSGAMDQCHHIQPVVEMSGLQDLSGDVLVDCPGPEDCDNVENAAMGQSMQHVASPVYMGPVTFTPVTSIALGSHLLPPPPPLPSSTVPNSMMFVPQVSAPGPGPVQYMLGPQQFVLQQEAVGVGVIPSHQKGLLGHSPPPPLVMEQTPVMAAPQMNVSMVGPLPPNHSSGQQPPMFARPPRLGPGGRAQQGMEFVGGKRQGDFVLVRQVPQQGVRMEASATVGPGNRPHQRAGGLDSGAGFPVQSGSGTVVAPLQQGQGVSFQPGWNKEQTRYHQANLGDARFGSQYPHGFPGSQRGPASQPVRSGGLVWPGQVSAAQHETWQQQGRRSVRSDSKGVASVGEEVSSLSLNQATNSSPMPMEMEAKPVLPVQAPSLLDVRFSTAGGGEDVRVLREVVQRFAAGNIR